MKQEFRVIIIRCMLRKAAGDSYSHILITSGGIIFICCKFCKSHCASDQISRIYASVTFALIHHFGTIIIVFSAAVSVINVENGQMKHLICGANAETFIWMPRHSKVDLQNINLTSSTTESRTVGLCGDVHTHPALSHLHPSLLRPACVHDSHCAGNTYWWMDTAPSGVIRAVVYIL